MIKVKIKTDNIDVTISSYERKDVRAWQPRYEYSIEMHNQLSNPSQLHRHIAEIRLPLRNELRSLCHDLRYKYFKIKIFGSMSTSMSQINQWEPVTWINLAVNPLNRYNRRYRGYDDGRWHKVISFLVNEKFREQLKTNTTVI